MYGTYTPDGANRYIPVEPVRVKILRDIRPDAYYVQFISPSARFFHKCGSNGLVKKSRVVVDGTITIL